MPPLAVTANTVLGRPRHPMSTQLALDLLQPLQPTLDNFVPGRNAEAVEALRRLIQARLPDRVLYLWGEPGSGRSHLLAALARMPGAWRWSPQDAPESPGLSLVDDVDALDADAQVALFNRLNGVRQVQSTACVVTGPAPPAQLALREDLRTRLAWGLVYQLRPLSDDEKAAALAAHAASRGVTLSDELIPYLLTHLRRDMRTLVAALDALDAHALAARRALTVPLARDWLQLRLAPAPAAAPAAPRRPDPA
jgi:DnaA family protein